jgi:glutamyl-tRNA synthetase
MPSCNESQSYKTTDVTDTITRLAMELIHQFDCDVRKMEETTWLTRRRTDQITLMGSENAIVRPNTADGTCTITGSPSIATSKDEAVAQPTDVRVHPLVDATPIDYDYLITKKKKETDDSEEFVTPVTEFC